ncbi:MAG: hypothetical protein JXR48_15940 [Candidatus Delongbacteria bacterium]|nr:hypothetical protein [Candidatus Delongbacteria bacterium]MBN2836449.1 hypothetical protein [Candidatus Delongbacteria bacterium]
MKKLTFLMILLISSLVYGNDSGLIYGTVKTEDGEIFKGNIRWDDEEIMWMDFFNSNKEENEYEDIVPDTRSRKEKKKTFVIGGFKVFTDKTDSHFFFSSTTHQFQSMFGDIDRIEVVGSDAAIVHMKNGKKYDFEGGSNDLGTTIRIMDHELGTVKLNWSKIKEVQFDDTPSRLDSKFGEPLYGKLETDAGIFEGYIIWDKEERISSDKLDGDTKNGEMSIEFGNIKSIERDGRGVEVTLKSGRDFYMKGTNDVNSDNRGIIVNIPEMGRIECQWREFRKVTFFDKPAKDLPEYDDFEKDGQLKGVVETEDDKSFEGNIIYDYDEAYGYEVLNGSKDDISYSIPFKFIKSIKPKNFNSSYITLRNGKEIVLGDERDVSDENSGILVSKGDEYEKIDWEDIKEITFK